MESSAALFLCLIYDLYLSIESLGSPHPKAGWYSLQSPNDSWIPEPSCLGLWSSGLIDMSQLEYIYDYRHHTRLNLEINLLTLVEESTRILTALGGVYKAAEMKWHLNIVSIWSPSCGSEPRGWLPWLLDPKFVWLVLCWVLPFKALTVACL